MVTQVFFQSAVKLGVPDAQVLNHVWSEFKHSFRSLVLREFHVQNPVITYWWISSGPVAMRDFQMTVQIFIILKFSSNTIFSRYRLFILVMQHITIIKKNKKRISITCRHTFKLHVDFPTLFIFSGLKRVFSVFTLGLVDVTV